MSKGSILILYNEVNEKSAKDELDVLYQVNAVSAALEQLDFSVSKQPLSKNPSGMFETLENTKPLIFNLVESVAGSGKLSYLFPSMLEALKLKYTGNSAEVLLLTSDKVLTKKLLKSCGIATPQWITARDENGFTIGDRYIVKPIYEDGSIDLDQNSIVTMESVPQAREILSAMAEKNGEEFFAEKYIEGREINVSLLQENGKPLLLPPTEIKFVGYKEKHIDEIFDYRSKWDTNSFGFKHAVSSCVFEDQDKPLLNELKEIAEKCWNEFGLKSYARIDFRIDKEGKPWVLEINANPCITPGDSSFLRSATQGGLDFSDVVNRIISAV